MLDSWLNLSIHPSWGSWLTDQRRGQLASIQQQIETMYYPAPRQVLRFLSTDLGQLHVVILGQDPYPQPGVATGRAFEVGGLTSWLTPFPQTSLRNILRLLYKTSQGIVDYSKIPSFTAIRRQIADEEWQILPPDQLFARWEEQGVLLLNTCLTVDGTPMSHRALWHDFTCELLQYISREKGELNWFLWGKSAQEFIPWIEYGVVYPSRHPMMCSAKYDDDFLKAVCFQETWDLVDWLGVRPLVK
jgi:uracil-DNA glycosylase